VTVLAGDVGGTKTVLALVESRDRAPAVMRQAFQKSDVYSAAPSALVAKPYLFSRSMRVDRLSQSRFAACDRLP